MGAQPVAAKQAHSSKPTQARFVVSGPASIAGAQIGQPHGSGLGMVPLTQAMVGQAMGPQLVASGVPASTGTQVGQPQAGVESW
jgi:hypothetical protein